MLEVGEVCLGVTGFDEKGFPSCHEPNVTNPEMYSSNVGVCIAVQAERAAESVQGIRGMDVLSPHISQNQSRRGEILPRLHLRCVLPEDNGEVVTHLTLTQMEKAVQLQLKYKDCFV